MIKLSKSRKILLTILFTFIVMLMLQINVNAGSYSQSYLANKFNEIRNMSGYRPGDRYTWNDGGWFSDYCSLGYPGHGGYQCHGYGINLFDWLFQQCAMCHQTNNNAYNLYVGDMVRVDNDSHTILIQDIVGDTIYYTDCNWGWTGQVRWDVSISRSELQSRLTYVCHADGNDVQSLSGDIEKPTISEIAIDPTKVTDDTIQVKVKASDNVGVSKVKFRIWRADSHSDSGTAKWGTYNSQTGYWEVEFSESDIKIMNDQLCRVDAWAFDDAGNESDGKYIYDFLFGKKVLGLGKFVARIVPKSNTNFCIGITGTNNDDNLELQNKNQNDESQLWEIEEISDGIYKIINLKSDKSMDVEGGTYVDYNGCNMQLWSYAGASQQQFLLQEYNGGYRIVPTNTGALRGLDILNGYIVDKNPIAIYEVSRIDNEAQTWEFEKVADSIKLSSSSVTLTKGSTKKLTATISPSTVANKTLSWSSSNTSVAKVSSTGLITAVGKGTATITVKTTDGTNKKATCKVTVNNTLPFIDVEKSDWFYSAVEYTYNRGIIKGATATEFRPDKNITRGDLVTILWRMEGEPTVTGVRNFPDVSTKSYYSKAIRWATKNKVVNGYQNGNFGPNDNITREQLATILCNYAKYKGKNTGGAVTTSRYTDWNKITGYARPAMIWAVDKGVVTGKNNGTKIDPQGTATRAETAGMIYNYCTKIM